MKRVFAVGIAGLILAALLNAGSILERSKEKPFGTERDVWVAVWQPIDWVSRTLYLDRPHQWIDEAIGRHDNQPGGIALPTPTPGDEAPGKTPEPEEPTETPEPEEPTPVPTLAPGELIRTASAEEPLQLWIGGDSQAQVFGQSLVALATDTGVIEPQLDYRISSGLTRLDYFNWPAHLANVAEEQDPDAMVLIFGANDVQGIETPDGEIFQPGEPGWSAEYRRRVAGTMDLLQGEVGRQFWVGQPIASSESYSERMAMVNTIFREEAEARPWVSYIDSWALFTDENGEYSAFLPDESGTPVDMRQGDGIHLTRAGGDRLATAVLDAVGDYFGIGAPYTE